MNKFIVMIASALLSLSAVAVPVYDQGSLPTAGDDGFSNISSGVRVAQTFQLGITGTLVELNVVGSGANLFIDIVGQIAGQPDDSNVLQTVFVGALAGSSAVTQVALNVPVVSGQLLAFVARGDSGQLRLTTSNTYVNGSLWNFVDASLVGGTGTWVANSGLSAFNLDLLFSTFVDAQAVPGPAPNTLAVFGLGLVMLGFSRRSKRHRA